MASSGRSRTDAWPAMGTSTIPALPGMLSFIQRAASLKAWLSLDQQDRRQHRHLPGLFTGISMASESQPSA